MNLKRSTRWKGPSMETRQAKFARLNFRLRIRRKNGRHRGRRRHGWRSWTRRAFNFRRKGGSSGFVSVRRTRSALWEQSRRKTSVETLARFPSSFRFVPLSPGESRFIPDRLRKTFLPLRNPFAEPSVSPRREVAIKGSDVSGRFYGFRFFDVPRERFPWRPGLARAPIVRQRGSGFARKPCSYWLEASRYDAYQLRRLGVIEWKQQRFVFRQSFPWLVPGILPSLISIPSVYRDLE